jgi:U32 family peptidase
LPSSNSRPKPELMSPVGHWAELRAAIEAGADAVYFGLTHFTARAKVGFTLEELPEVMRALHVRGVRGFLTFNTLIFDEELCTAAEALEGILRAGADALIIQDPAAIRLAREIAPGVEIHASTQTSVTNADGVRWAAALGASRVNLARELSLADIRKIRSEVDTELETFVHGALCVAYSGQCFSSEAWGGRSANRGQCAQACRLPYEMLVDGKLEPLGDARYLLSPGDLCGIEQIPELIDIGISAFKIEGRYKDADYVAATTRAYRKAIDEAWAGRVSTLNAAGKLELEQVYSRGLGAHFLSGTNHQTVVRGRAPRHRGVLAGHVISVGESEVQVRQEAGIASRPLKPGDGVVFDAADWRSPGEPEEGGRVFEVVPGNGSVTLRFGNRAVNFQRIRTGDWVWRTSDPDIEKALRPLTEAKVPVHRQPVTVRVRASAGAPVETTWTVGGTSVTITSAEPASEASQHALTVELLREQLSRLGNTAYRLEQLDAEIVGAPFVPTSVLNQIRREAVERLAAAQALGPQLECRSAALAVPAITQTYSPSESLQPQVHVLVRTNEQLDAAIEARPASITLDYLDLYGLKPSVERVRAVGIPLRVATPRVIKPGEEKIVDFLLRLECDLLIRPAGLVEPLSQRSKQGLTGDFSLNAANAVTASAFLQQGLSRLAPTHDLNAAQVAELARAVGPGLIEAIAYQHLPVFHTEHCVFCRFLSTGTSYLDCGRPCEKHLVALRDSQGRAHPVLADIGCRNTVFGAEAQVAAAHMKAWRDAGIVHFRLEFAHETATETRGVIDAFSQALRDGNFVALAEKLKRVSPQGTTQGSLFVPASHPALHVLR